MSKRGANKKYTAAFKKTVVETMSQEHLSCVETAERFGLRHKSVRDWERIYLTEGPEGFLVERRGRGRSGRLKKLHQAMEEDLLSEVQRLRAEVAYLKNLQALVLEDEHKARKKR